MHGSVLGFFAYGALQSSEVAGKDVLEVGSLDVNGSVRPMVMARQPASYLGVDMVDGPGVDRVLDAVDLLVTFGVDAFDVVISTEMLEHATDWQRAIVNMVGVLRPGGVLVWTTRSPGFAYHHPPDRWRYTQQAMATILERCGLEPMVLMDDPEHPGVFCKAKKPAGWRAPSHADPLADVPGVTPIHEPLKILAFPGQPDGCGYYRMWQPLSALRRYSGHLLLLPPASEPNLTVEEDDLDEFDLVVRQRPVIGQRDWQRWRQHAPVVAELDDDIFNPDPSGLPFWLDEDLRGKVQACVETADLVTVSTPWLAERMARHNPNVVVLPNHIHERLLQMQRPQRDRLTVCWAGGSTHIQDLTMVQQPLRDTWHDSQGQFDLHLLGMDWGSLFAYGRLPLPADRVRFTNWQRNIWDYYAAIDADIGIVPLAPTPFNRARSDIKTLEYAALGIPVIASDLDPYRDFVVDGVTGYLVQTEDQWRQRLADLLNDPGMRAEMGAKAKQVAAGRTIQQGWRLWASAYEHLAGWPASKQGGTA